MRGESAPERTPIRRDSVRVELVLTAGAQIAIGEKSILRTKVSAISDPLTVVDVPRLAVCYLFRSRSTFPKWTLPRRMFVDCTTRSETSLQSAGPKPTRRRGDCGTRIRIGVQGHSGTSSPGLRGRCRRAESGGTDTGSGSSAPTLISVCPGKTTCLCLACPSPVLQLPEPQADHQLPPADHWLRWVDLKVPCSATPPLLPALGSQGQRDWHSAC